MKHLFIEAQKGQSILETCIVQLLAEYYKEFKNTKGLTPSEISKELGIFRGTNTIKGGMRMNDAIVTGLLQNLMIKKQVEKIQESRGQYRLTKFMCQSLNLIK